VTPPKMTVIVSQLASVQKSTVELSEGMVVVVDVVLVVVVGETVVVVVGGTVVVVIFGGCRTTRSAMIVPSAIVREFIIAFEV